MYPHLALQWQMRFKLPITFYMHTWQKKTSLQAIKPDVFILHFHDKKTLTDL